MSNTRYLNRADSREQSPEVESTSTYELSRSGVGIEIDESRRKKLREIELKVAEYAEKLEAKGGGKKGANIAEKCNQYRAKLLEVRILVYQHNKSLRFYLG